MKNSKNIPLKQVLTVKNLYLPKTNKLNVNYVAVSV